MDSQNEQAVFIGGYAVKPDGTKIKMPTTEYPVKDKTDGSPQT